MQTRQFISFSLLLYLHLFLLHGTRGVDPQQPQINANDWKNIVHNMVHNLYIQREPGHTQFGFIVLGNLPTPTSITLRRTAPNHSVVFDNASADQRQPDTRSPLIDVPTNLFYKSPSNRNQYVNYVVAAPVAQRSPSGMSRKIHSEETLLGELQILKMMYNRTYGLQPDFVLLYSWIMPCCDPDFNQARGCTGRILTEKNKAANAGLTWIVAHTTDGCPPDWVKSRVGLPYMTRRGNEQNRQWMMQNGITVFRIGCRHNYPETGPINAGQGQLRNQLHNPINGG
ncbi:hypothetical protein BaRGS_00013649 [Batillaria attramentaria]|uniref:Uncharacterized protein n=1 Tax=Batillaria attramentaria TaxID=370345 RepID=A0ABD0L7H5_9CAEN